MVTKYELAGLSLADSAVAAASGSDALVVLTEWPEFRTVDGAEILKAMTGNVVVDTRRVLDRDKWQAVGAVFLNASSRAV
jgi:UDPglucose 6-dehydrogenase